MGEVDAGEAGRLDRGREVSFAGAALEDPRPRSTDDPLRPARRRALFCRDVLGEAEPPSRSQDTANLGEGGCRVDLDMRFAFRNPMSAVLFEPLFEQTASSLVDAFVSRARALDR